MRHGKKVIKLGRKSAHRQAMFANMASSLILHKRINTTLAKGKALRMYVEPLITKCKNDTTHSRRVVFSYLQNKEAVTELFREISVKIADRPGGYTRVLKTGTRLGDNAEMCLIELVDYNENLLATKEEAKAKPTRRRRGSGKKKAEEKTAKVAEETNAAAAEPEVAEETQKVEEPEKETEATLPVEEAPAAEATEETNAKAEAEPEVEVEPEAETKTKPEAESETEAKAEDDKPESTGEETGEEEKK